MKTSLSMLSSMAPKERPTMRDVAALAQVSLKTVSRVVNGEPTVAAELADRVEFFDAVEDGLPIFERFHIYEQLHKALDRKVWLPSGGSPSTR